MKSRRRVVLEEEQRMNKKVARCIICNEEFCEKDIKAASCCPKCNNKGLPANPKDDVIIKINWHELRILCIWAENWARKCDKDNNEALKCVLTVNCIARRIQNQHQDKLLKLTLSGEIEDLIKDHAVETTFDTKQDKIAGEFNA